MKNILQKLKAAMDSTELLVPVEEMNMMNVENEDSGEYGEEGGMAKSDLKTLIRNAQELHDMLDEETDLPEHVQSKIVLAAEYIVDAANYMKSEMEHENSEEEYENSDEMSEMEGESEEMENESSEMEED